VPPAPDVPPPLPAVAPPEPPVAPPEPPVAPPDPPVAPPEPAVPPAPPREVLVPPLPPVPVFGVSLDEHPKTARPNTKTGTANLFDIDDAPCQLSEERRLSQNLP
jgi:hypothetical protein